MSILDKIGSIPGLEGAKRGFLPDKPDGCLAIFEYEAGPPEHSFSGTDLVYRVQVRARDASAPAAYARAKAAAEILNRYRDAEISVLQSSPILDIGCDGANPPRREYTVNFTVRRY